MAVDVRVHVYVCVGECCVRVLYASMYLYAYYTHAVVYVCACVYV